MGFFISRSNSLLIRIMVARNGVSLVKLMAVHICRLSKIFYRQIAQIIRL